MDAESSTTITLTSSRRDIGSDVDIRRSTMNAKAPCRDELRRYNTMKRGIDGILHGEHRATRR